MCDLMAAYFSRRMDDLGKPGYVIGCTAVISSGQNQMMLQVLYSYDSIPLYPSLWYPHDIYHPFVLLKTPEITPSLSQLWCHKLDKNYTVMEIIIKSNTQPYISHINPILNHISLISSPV